MTSRRKPHILARISETGYAPMSRSVLMISVTAFMGWAVNNISNQVYNGFRELQEIKPTIVAIKGVLDGLKGDVSSSATRLTSLEARVSMLERQPRLQAPAKSAAAPSPVKLFR